MKMFEFHFRREYFVYAHEEKRYQSMSIFFFCRVYVPIEFVFRMVYMKERKEWNMVNLCNSISVSFVF